MMKTTEELDENHHCRLLFDLLQNKKDVNEKAILKLLYEHPDVCGAKYKWWDTNKVAPLLLHRICEIENVSIDLIKATYEGHPESILLSNYMQRLPLHCYCQNNHNDAIIRYLVNLNPNALVHKDRGGMIPLHWACRNGLTSPDTIRFLLSSCKFPKQPRLEHETPLLNLIFKDNSRVSSQVLQVLLSEYPSSPRETDLFGRLPLHIAAEEGFSCQIIDMLVTAFPRSVSRCDGNKRLPLHSAAEHKPRLELVTKLISLYPQAISERDDGGWIPLHSACGHAASASVIRDALIAAYPQGVKSKSESGKLPLHSACIGGACMDVIRCLIEKYPNGVREKDLSQRLPLHWACERELNDRVCLLLLQEYPESVCEMDDKGQLPLHCACQYRASPEIIRILIKRYRQGLQVKDACGTLPLHLACKSGACTEVISLLAMEYPNAVSQLDQDRVLPLYWACRGGASLEAISCLVSLYPQGVRQEDPYEHRLAVHHACEEKASIDVIRYLLSEYRQAVKHKDCDGMLPLHLASAAKTYSTDIIRLLALEYPGSIMMDPQSADDNKSLFDNSRRLWNTQKTTDACWCWRNKARKGHGMEHEETDYRMFAIRCDTNEPAALDRMLQAIQQQPHADCLVAIGRDQTTTSLFQVISKALRFNQTLTSLSLANNAIGDAGAESLASMLMTNRNLETLDLQNCSLSHQGLSALLCALGTNRTLTELDLSYNRAIFNARGGRAIADWLSSNNDNSSSLKKCFLYWDEDDYYYCPAEFMSELVCMLRWNHAKHWPLLLNRLQPDMWKLILYYRSTLHRCILLGSKARLSFLHWILERVQFVGGNDPELFYCYLRSSPECFIRTTNNSKV